MNRMGNGLAAMALAWGLACSPGERNPDPAEPERSRLAELLAQRNRERGPAPADRYRKRSVTPEERARLEAEYQAREAQARRDLEDPSAPVRAAALEHVDVEGPGRDRVFALAQEDPDPAVRAAALDRVSEEESEEALQILYAGLSDEDPDVVLAAIDAIEYAGDASSVPHLRKLAAESADPGVRERAEDAASFLE